MSPDELILQADHCPGLTGVALPGTASEELTIDSSGLVTLGGNDVQAPVVDHARAKLDVRAPTGHIGGDCNAPLLAGAGDYLSLLLVPHGVQHLMWEVLFREHAAERFAGADASRTDEDGRSALVQVSDFVNHRPPYHLGGRVDSVGQRCAGALCYASCARRCARGVLVTTLFLYMSP